LSSVEKRGREKKQIKKERERVVFIDWLLIRVGRQEAEEEKLYIHSSEERERYTYKRRT
jgi:hypothetical protein